MAEYVRLLDVQSEVIQEQAEVITKCTNTTEALRQDIAVHKEMIKSLNQSNEEQTADIEENSNTMENLNQTVQQQLATMKENENNIKTLNQSVEALGDRLDQSIQAWNKSECV